MPITYAPPWIHTMTGSPAPGSGSGDQMFTVSQSPATSCVSASLPKCPPCGGGGPLLACRRRGRAIGRNRAIRNDNENRRQSYCLPEAPSRSCYSAPMICFLVPVASVLRDRHVVIVEAMVAMAAVEDVCLGGDEQMFDAQ